MISLRESLRGGPPGRKRSIGTTEGKTARPPFTAWGSRFLRRTALATLATLILVTMTVTVYGIPAWAGYYLATGLWSLVFLALTPLIVKAIMFDRRPLAGLGLAAVKVVWLGLMLAFCLHWSAKAASPMVFKTALIAGVTTPLAVIVLRAVGAACEHRSGAASGLPDPHIGRGPNSGLGSKP